MIRTGAVFKRVGAGADTRWSVVYGGRVIGQVKRTGSFGRGYTKSQMSTRHISVWQGSVADVEHLEENDRRVVERLLRRRDKSSQASAARYMLDSYKAANVALPVHPVSTNLAA
jgi:hypothetical protein